MKIIKVLSRLNNIIQFQTLRSKLILSFLIFGLIPLIVFAFLSYNTYLGTLQQRITTYSQGVADRISSNLDKYLIDIKNILNMKDDYYINQFIKLLQAGDCAGNRKYIFRLWEDLNNLVRIKQGLGDIALTFSDGRRISCNGLYYAEPFTMSLYKKISKKDDITYLVTGPHKNFLGDDVITIARVFDMEKIREKVMISADIKLDIIESITNVKLGEKGYIFILNDNGRIIYHPNHQMIGKRSKVFTAGSSNMDNNFFNGTSEYIATYAFSEFTGWKIISLAHVREVGAELFQLKNITLIVILIILVLIIFLTMYLSSTLTKPLRELEGLTKKAANNDLGVEINPKGNDEISQLGRSFNVMIKRIKELMDENIEEQKLIRKLEMESLENQIKPHFIYNTLDLIISQLEQNNNKKASNLIEALGNFFRISLSYGKEFVPIKKELEHVKNYLFIQQQRHGGEYDYIIEEENENILDYYIPKLLLQPLVENSIYHGILKSEKRGLIIIKAYSKEDYIYFEIIDNGLGIPEDKLKDINLVLQGYKKIEDEKKYFGIRNVNKRIKLKYGDDFGLRFESQEGVGTKAIVKIGKHI